MQAGPEDIALAVERLRAKRLVAFPTETVYGLGAPALDAEAVAGVFRVKGRPSNNPLIVHVVDEAMARRVCADWPAHAATLAADFWPGPLTLVVPRSADVPDVVTAGGPTVAVRSPRHPLTLALLEALGEPLVGPSANRSGGVSPTCADHVRESFSEDEVFVLDGGPCVGGIESTVVDVSGERVRVLRPGLISAEQIAASIGESVESGGHGGHGGHEGPARSPGQVGPHYAPRAPARLIEEAELAGALAGLEPGTSAAVLTRRVDHVTAPHHAIAMPPEGERYAARLYAALREADATRPAVVLIVKPWPGGPISGVWSAIADRLGRATSPRDR
ncbi:MAG: L-threonylcarbamoyladenylate synthase [Phycisphaerales bacterium JB054]